MKERIIEALEEIPAEFRNDVGSIITLFEDHELKELYETFPLIDTGRFCPTCGKWMDEGRKYCSKQCYFDRNK